MLRFKYATLLFVLYVSLVHMLLSFFAFLWGSLEHFLRFHLDLFIVFILCIVFLVVTLGTGVHICEKTIYW